MAKPEWMKVAAATRIPNDEVERRYFGREHRFVIQ
jgi:hypothetical protein